MSALTTSLACLELRSLARGYQILNLVTRDESLRVLEATPVDANRFLLLLSGEQAALAKTLDEVARKAHGAILDFEFIGTPHPDLQPAIYSLVQGQLGEALLVVETESASRILSCAQLLLLDHDLKLVEIKVGRGLRGQGLGFFTGSLKNANDGKAAVQAILKGMNRIGVAEVIENPTKSFREFFSLSGN